MKKLFLDDVRNIQSIYPGAAPDEFVLLRSYEEFVAHIKANGLPDFISFDNDLGLLPDGSLTFGHAYRSDEEQLRLYERGLSKTLNSQHLKRLAVDFHVFLNGRLCLEWTTIKILGDYWEALHPKNRWGGDWNGNDMEDGFIDTPHFEMLETQ